MPRAEYGMNNSDTEGSEGSPYEEEPEIYPPSPPREVRGVPIKCYTCGLPVVIRQPTTGINAGKKLYVCTAPEAEFEENHTYRFWDEVMEEEVSDLKAEVRRLRDSLTYITSDVRGQPVDPRQMWARVILLRDQLDVKLHTCVADMKYVRIAIQKAEQKFKKLQNILLTGKED